VTEHDKHLPKSAANKAVKGMDDRDSGGFGRDVAKGQGQTTKTDAKNARAGQRRDTQEGKRKR
jgi:hypothetical protein